MREIKNYNLNYILIIIFYVLLNIILCILTYNNFNYIFTICELLIINKTFYILLITILIMIIILFYLIIINFHDKKMLNSSLIIMTILIVIFFILSIYLRLKVDISKSSEIFYNGFLDIKLIKIIWNQEELMTIYKYHSIEKGYTLLEETILAIIAESKNPEQLIEKLNLIYNTLKKTTILDATLNFLYNHKYKIILGTGVAILSIASAAYIIPILISKFAVAPIIETVQENPVVEFGPQEHLTAEGLRNLYRVRTEDIESSFTNIEMLNDNINQLGGVVVRIPGMVKTYIQATKELHINVFTKTNCKIKAPDVARVLRNSMDGMLAEIATADQIEKQIMDIFTQ